MSPSSTVHSSSALLLSLLSLTTLTTAQSSVISIDVGKSGLVFDPDSVTAPVGSTLNFFFYNRGNHSVAQSDFSSPCAPSDGGVFSGFFPGPPSQGQALNIWSYVVTSEDPIWLYCSQGDHCQEGMGMVVNPPSGGDQTLDAYLSAAGGVAENVSPASIAGGVIRAASDTAALSTATPTPTPTPSSSAAASSSAEASSSASSAASSSASAAASSSASAAMSTSSEAASSSAASSSAAAMSTSTTPQSSTPAAATTTSETAATTTTNSAAVTSPTNGAVKGLDLDTRGHFAVGVVAAVVLGGGAGVGAWGMM